jgi:4-hydroxybenzoate polyprenyltransferase
VNLQAALRLLRPKQWAKNLLVFAAYIFAAKFSDPDATRNVLIAFAAMCLLSSATYVANDIFDRNKDREHPLKRNRPIASGAASIPIAWALSLILLAAGMFLVIAFLNTTSLVLVLSYLAIQMLYNGSLRQIPVADVFAIALGFVIRATLGAAAIWVPVSGWLLFCTGALALMLGFAKRRNEFLLQGNVAVGSRQSLGGYTRPALDALVISTATASALCYGIYAIESDTAAKYPALILTTVFVSYGIARYVFLIFTRDEGGEPADVLFGDPHILGSVVLFLITAVIAVSGVHIPLLEK